MTQDNLDPRSYLIISCGNDHEDASHYFFECENFNNLRILMFHRVRPLHPLSLNMMLYGKPSLSNDENFLLFSDGEAIYKSQWKIQLHVLPTHFLVY